MVIDMKPIHPGEVLLEVYIKPSAPGLTVEMLSKTLGVSEQLLTNLINGSQSITPLLARQLSVICRTTAEYWIQLQRTYDKQVAKHKRTRQRHLNGTRTNHPAAAA